MQSYTRNRNIIESFTAATGGAPKVIYQPGLVSPYDKTNVVRFNGFITTLRMKVDISSLDESELPDLEITASRTDRLAAVRDLEWKSPRRQIDFFLQNTYTGMIQIASVSLLNRFPYYHVNLMSYFTDGISFDIGNDTLLQARIVDVGYGLLGGNDEVTIFGSVKEEATLLPTEKRDISYGTSHEWPVTTDSQILLPANPHRLQVTIVNRNFEHDAFLSYGPIAEVGKGIPLLKGGGTYEINSTNPYKGVISAVAAGPTTLGGIEAV